MKRHNETFVLLSSDFSGFEDANAASSNYYHHHGD